MFAAIDIMPNAWSKVGRNAFCCMCDECCLLWQHEYIQKSGSTVLAVRMFEDCDAKFQGCSIRMSRVVAQEKSTEMEGCISICIACRLY